MFILPVVERYARRRLNALGIRSRYVETPQARIHLYEHRAADVDGPPIVIFHGLGASATSFGPVMAMLRQASPRILAPEAPGHGFSRPYGARFGLGDLLASLSAVLERELDEPAILVGNSLGGAMAMRYASLYPERVAGLVLASPAGAPLPDDLFRELVGKFQIQSLRDAHELLSRLYHRPPWFRALLTPDIRRHFRSPFFRDLLESFNQSDALTPEELTKIHAPTLLLWGRSERLLPPASLDFFRAHLPEHAEIVEPDDFGHCPNLDRPRALAERIASFARSLKT
ncbi:MAG: alpha/beta hydrolase [Myxococcales bacterium]|nr:alpha/beta hydrolase [Myxococcales bacterium]